MSDKDVSNGQIKMIKDILDKKFTKANTSIGDMLKNKAFNAIQDFKSGFKYVSIGKTDTEPSKEA